MFFCKLQLFIKKKKKKSVKEEIFLICKSSLFKEKEHFSK